jgi:hypothetical protein
MAADLPLDDSRSASNPYAAPLADLREPPAGAGALAGAAAIRRALIGREKAIKRLAWINLPLAVIWFPATVASLFSLVVTSLRELGFDLGAVREAPIDLRGPALLGLALFHTGLFALYVALLFGVRGLRPWARWTMAGLYLVFLLLFVIGYSLSSLPPRWVLVTLVVFAAVVGGVLYVLISPPSGKVFSREYRKAVTQTRGMRF